MLGVLETDVHPQDSASDSGREAQPLCAPMTFKFTARPEQVARLPYKLLHKRLNAHGCCRNEGKTKTQRNGHMSNTSW